MQKIHKAKMKFAVKIRICGICISFAKNVENSEQLADDFF